MINPEINACTVLQSYIRKNNAENLVITPKEISRLGSIPGLNTKFSTIVADSLQKAIADPSNYGKPLHFYDQLGTFYITIAPDLSVATIEMKENPKKWVGSGTYREVFRGHEMKIPLTSTIFHRSITTSPVAISRPLKEFERYLNLPNQAHKKIYDQFIEKGLPGYLTEPGRAGFQELIGPCYWGDLNQMCGSKIERKDKEGLTHYLKFEEQLLLIIEIFQTLESLHELGVIHRDVCPGNILLGEQNKAVHAYLNDFHDLANGEMPLGTNSDYPYWDKAGQSGFISHASDIVGAMFSACNILSFPLGNLWVGTGRYKFYGHVNFLVSDCLKSRLEQLLKYVKYEDHPQGNTTLERILDLTKKDKHSRSYSLKAELKIVQAFHQVFAKEEAWKNQLMGSCLCYFANLTADEYKAIKDDKALLKQKYLDGVNAWGQKQLMKSLDADLLNKMKMSPDEISKAMPEDILDILFTMRSRPTLEQLIQFDHLETQYKTLSGSFWFFEKMDLPEADPTLFSLLMSDDPQKRREGRELGYTFFDSAGDIKRKLQTILQEYQGDLKT